MSPLPGHQVIPDNWSTHHQPTAEATMTGTCSIYDGATGPEPWPPVEGWTPWPPGSGCGSLTSSTAPSPSNATTWPCTTRPRTREALMANDFLRLAADIAAARARSETLTSQVVRKVAADVETNAKAIAPVDTGNLRASIGTEMRGRYEAEVGPTAEYGLWLEVGTSTMAPRPYMWPSADRAEPSFVEAMGRIGDL